MVISEFFIKYAEEANCKAFFKAQRVAEHTSCKKCGSVNVFWQEKESRWRCKDCKHAMGLKNGTVMENSNLSYRIWLWGLFLMSLTKKGFSALEVQRMIGHKRYEPIWLMMQKIRMSMGSRDDKHTLDGYIEMDEGFFEGHRKKEIVEGVVENAKELDRQVKAIVAVSTRPVDAGKQKKLRPKTSPGFLKMSVVSSLSTVDVCHEAEKMLDKSATVITDGRRCYNGLKEIVKVHKSIVVKDKKEISTLFPWVHIAISNAKKKILGLHHQVNDQYMQNYLNEFCYKFNRRFFGEKLFDRLVIAALSQPWYK